MNKYPKSFIIDLMVDSFIKYRTINSTTRDLMALVLDDIEKVMENPKQENKCCDQLCGCSQESPFAKLQRHRSELDRSLSSIKGFTEESKLVRMYIVGQIEALDFAMRLFEV